MCPLATRSNISAGHPTVDLPEETAHVDTDTLLQPQPPSLTWRPLARKTALPLRHRTIPTQSVRFQIVSGVIAEPSIHGGALWEPAAHRNARRTPPPSLAFHSSTANRDLLSPANGPVVLLQY